MNDEKHLSGTSLTEGAGVSVSASDAATARHTDGPWCVDWVIDGAFQISGTSVGDRCVLAQRAAFPDRHFEFAANAHLIAAAPELKDVCAQLVEFQRVYALNTHDTAPGNRHYSEMLMRVVARASAAIAKSEGK